MTNQKECARCISDTSIPDIRFDEHGVCNYCNINDKLGDQFRKRNLFSEYVYFILCEVLYAGKSNKKEAKKKWSMRNNLWSDLFQE